MLQRRLRAAFGLTLVILGVEVAGGVVSHSLALLSDAGHVVTDFFALGLAWFAAAQANRPADIRKTYGYHRVGIIAALANAVTLLLIVVGIGVEAAQRFRHPEPTTPLVMIAAAAVGHHPEPGDRPRATSGRRCSRGLCWRGSRSASQRRPVHDGRPGRTPRSCAAPRSGLLGLTQAVGDPGSTAVVGVLWAAVSPTLGFGYAAAWMLIAIVAATTIGRRT